MNTDANISTVNCPKHDVFYASYTYLQSMHLRLRCIDTRLLPTDYKYVVLRENPSIEYIVKKKSMKLKPKQVYSSLKT